MRQSGDWRSQDGSPRRIRFMARRPQRRNRQGRPPARPVPASWSTVKWVSIGGLVLAIGAIALGLAGSRVSSKNPPGHLAEARAFLKAGTAAKAERALRAT